MNSCKVVSGQTHIRCFPHPLAASLLWAQPVRVLVLLLVYALGASQDEELTSLHGAEGDS